jgi:hypothetical protein
VVRCFDGVSACETGSRRKAGLCAGEGAYKCCVGGFPSGALAHTNNFAVFSFWLSLRQTKKSEENMGKSHDPSLRIRQLLPNFFAELDKLPQLLKEHPLSEDDALILKERLLELSDRARDAMLAAIDQRILQEARDRDDYRGLMTGLTHKLWECDDETRERRARRLLGEVNVLMTSDEREAFQQYICRAWNIALE